MNIVSRDEQEPGPGRRHRSRLRTAVAAFLVGGAVLSLGALMVTSSEEPTTTVPDGTVAAVAPSQPEDPAPGLGELAPAGCTVAQMVEPGEYESVGRAGTSTPVWVIVPDSYRQIAPAPLYLLGVTGAAPTGLHLDMLRPTFEALEGVIVVTAVDADDDSFSRVIAEVAAGFCVDPDRIITSMVPQFGQPTSPAPDPLTQDDGRRIDA